MDAPLDILNIIFEYKNYFETHEKKTKLNNYLVKNHKKIYRYVMVHVDVTSCPDQWLNLYDNANLDFVEYIIISFGKQKFCLSLCCACNCAIMKTSCCVIYPYCDG